MILIEGYKQNIFDILMLERALRYRTQYSARTDIWLEVSRACASFGHLLETPEQPWLSPDMLSIYARAIREKDGVLIAGDLSMAQ